MMLMNKTNSRDAEYVLKDYNGTSVIITTHARRRAMTRHGMPADVMKTYFKHIVDGLNALNFRPVEYNQEVFVYVRAFQRGCVIALRRDFRQPDKKALAMAVVTIYPYGKSRPVKGDTFTITI